MKNYEPKWNTPLMKYDSDGVPSLIQRIDHYYDPVPEYPFERPQICIKLFNGYMIHIPKWYVMMLPPDNLPKNLEDEFFLQKVNQFVIKNLDNYLNEFKRMELC